MNFASINKKTFKNIKNDKINVFLAYDSRQLGASVGKRKKKTPRGFFSDRTLHMSNFNS